MSDVNKIDERSESKANELMDEAYQQGLPVVPELQDPTKIIEQKKEAIAQAFENAAKAKEDQN